MSFPVHIHLFRNQGLASVTNERGDHHRSLSIGLGGACLKNAWHSGLRVED